MEMAERIADGSAEKDRSSVRRAAWRVQEKATRNAARVASRAAARALERKIGDMIDAIGRNAAEATAWHAARQADPDYTDLAKADETWDTAHSAECSLQCRLLRCAFGPLPFRPVSVAPAWLTWHDGLLASMARQMYDSRDFRDMPVLADALEEAGCDNADILAHCRQPGSHVRGCWVVDLLLGKC